ARLRLKDEPAQLLQLAPAAQQIAARFTITEPGLYAWWLELTDLDGFEDADAPRFEILAVPDTVPQVFIEQPQTDLNVTANAVIPVEVTARDDIGLRQVRLPYRTGSRGGLLSEPAGQPLKEVILFDAAVPGPEEFSTRDGQPADQPPGEQRQPALPLERIAAHQWDLEQLQLEPGMQLSFHAEATDDCDLGEPHIGRSAARLLTVVSSDDKVRELLAGQAGLLDDLEQILQSQQKARESVDSLLIQLREAGELRTEDRDLLKQVEIDQRAIASRLMTPTASVHARVRRLIDELERNRLEEPDLAQRLSQLNTELTQLGETRLPSITGNITTARKLMQSAPPSPPSPAERTPADKTPADGKPGTEKPDTDTPDTEKPGTENPATGTPETGTPRTETASGKSGSQTAPAVPSAAPDQAAPNQPETPDTPGPAEAPEAPGTLSPETLKKQDPPPANPPGKQDPTANNPQAGSSGSPQPEADSDQPETVPQQMLARVESEQELVVESLRAMVNRLSRWQNQADLERELAELKGGQEKLNRESTELGSRTLARPLAMLTPQERADLQKLADRQSRQTEKLQQLERRIGQAADALENRDELLADRLRSVRDMARDLVADGEIPQAAESLSRNETGQATRLQQSISRRMQNLQDALENRGISDTETLLGQLRQAENELEQLRKKQEELLRKTDPETEGSTAEEREQQLEQLHREQEQLKSEARQLARRLTRLRAWQAGDTLRRSSASMDRASGQLESPPEEDQLEQLRRRVEETQQEALDDLDQARRELARTREQVQEVLEQEAIEKVAEHIRGMIGRQQQVIEETERLEGLRAARGNWSRAQLKSLRDLADVQEGLQSETAQLAEQAESAAVFSLALKGAARLMQQAAALLRDRQTGPSTVAIEQRAKQRFEQLASVLDEQPENGQPPAGEAEQQEQDPETGRPPQDSISLRAEVRLLQALQQSLLERTTALDAQRVDGELPPAQQQELDNVVEEQAALVELAAQLIARFRRSLGGDEEAGSRQPENAPAEEGRPPRSEPEPRSQTEPQLPGGSAPARTDLKANQPEPAGTPSS
ncbi:MAG: hypothetical protein KDA79_19525, partial [Planctomycetaceae bacterium]|nr:hypothetical protein [Planctomycetaceae bacterium]